MSCVASWLMIYKESYCNRLHNRLRLYINEKQLYSYCYVRIDPLYLSHHYPLKETKTFY